MERKRFCSFILVLVLLLTMLPVGVYAEDPPGTVRVSSQGEFNLALTDGSVDHIIAESVELDIQQGTELTKDLTITSTAGLRISDNGLFIVYSGVTLTVDGYIVVRQNGELRVGGMLVNNGMVNVGGVLSAAAPAVIQNNGSLAISDDPAIGEGLISFIDILSDTESESLVVTLAGSVPEVTGGAIKRTADVNGPASLDYALADPQYNGIWFTEFHDERDDATGQTTGAAMIYPRDLTITKPLDIFDNDEMLVTGNLTVQGPEGSLYIGGDLTVAGNFANSGDMFIEGSLTLGGTATNSAYYTQSAEAVVNGIITDVGDGDHMRGYYVTNQGEWETALADSAHCNPIVIGAEAVSGSAIAVTTDTAITSNLFVEGDLIINEGVTFTVGMRYDGDTNGVSNDVMGALINNGTLELIVPFAVSGTLVNNGTVWTAAYNGDEYGQNWTEDGSILLYTWRDEAEVLPARSGHLENNGLILNDSTIAINDGATALNSPAGLIEGGAISNWWDFAPENTFPLINEGIIRFADIDQKINYTHLAYRDLDNTGSGWYENPEYGYGYELSCQPGNQYYGLFGLWDYDGVSETWGFTAVTPGALALSSGSGISLNVLDPSEVSTDPAQDVGNSAAFLRMDLAEWGDHEISYAAADSTVYRMAVTVDLPPMGYYTAATASRETYLNSATYTPGAGEVFYAIVNGDFSEGWTSNFEILTGADQVTVATTAAVNVYEVTVNPETTGNFGFNLKILLDNAAIGAYLDPAWWIDLYEAETEGLVFSWTQWRDEDSLGIQYPVINRDGGEISYNTSLETGPGGQMLSFFYRHWVGDESTGSWVYTPVPFDQLTATSGSGIVFSTWQNDQAVLITDEDYTEYEFTEFEIPFFGSYAIGYHNGTENFTLPISVGLPDVAFYSAPEATQENYIGAFSYGPTEAERQFYLITAPNPGIDPSWTNDVLVHDGSGYVTVSATGDRDVFLVTIDPDTTGNFRLRAEIRYFDGENQVWQSDRDMLVSEAPAEGLVFSWADWRDIEGGGNYPIPAMDEGGAIIVNTLMNVAVGGVTVPLFYRHLSGEEWILTPVDPAEIIVPSGSGITVQEWTAEGADSVTDEDYTNWIFTEMFLNDFGSFELGYDTGAEILTLTVDTELPGAGYYSAAAASEENYISEFHYGPAGRSYYLIADPDITIGDGWTCEYEILDGADKVAITTTGALGVFLVTVNDATEGDARLHAKVRYFDDTHAECWQADRDITMHETEVPGLFCSGTDWRAGDGFHYPILTGDPSSYGRRIETATGDSTYAVFYKHWVGDDSTGEWEYTPVDTDQLIITSTSGITAATWAHENMASIPADDAEYHGYSFTDFHFSQFGDFTIGYLDGETLYEMPVRVALPNLAAYTVPGGGEGNWLPEVPFDQYRAVYLVPTVDLSAMDLTQSTFYLPDGAGEIPYAYDEGTKTFSKAEYGSVAAHETEGVVDYFTMDISALPFDPDFDLGLRLRDGAGQEIVGTTIRFVSDLPDMPSTFSGITLTTPTTAGVAYDTFTSLSDVPAQSMCYARFVSGNLGGNGYRFSLNGDSTGTRLYLFDMNWMLLEQSASEDLSQAGRTASIWATGLTNRDDYYLAVSNESVAISDYELSAGLRSIPPAPTVTDPFYGPMFTMGVNASGATEGQHYILYAKIDGQWQWKGDEPYDADNEPRFIHLFDFLQPGETAQSIGVAIGSDGVEGPITEREGILIREDVQAATPAAIELMEELSPGSGTSAIRLLGGVFDEETYYRLHHENELGEWDYNASYFGDGTNIAQGGGYIDPEGDFDTGPWILAKYRSVDDGPGYKEGWETLIDTRIDFGSLLRRDFDLFNAMPDTENNRVDLSVEVRSQKPETARAARLMYALYDSDGRLIDLVLRPKDLTAGGLSDSVSISFDPANRPARCKIFVLNEGCGPETEALMRTLEFDE
jgi:hypothetical protein